MVFRFRWAVRFIALLGFVSLPSGCGVGLCSELGDCASGMLALSGSPLGTRNFLNSVTGTFTLTNSGSLPATALNPLPVVAPFAYDGGSYPGTGGTCTETLAAGASCTLRIRFTAAPPVGTQTGTLAIDYETGVGWATATLTLSAVAENGTFVTTTAFNADTNVIRPLPSPSTKLYVTGSFTNYQGNVSTYLARINGDGTFDTSFVNGGFDNMVRPVTLATDGSGDIYAGGDFSNYAGSSRNAIVRINSDGTIDDGFAVGTGFDNTVFDIAVAQDGSGDVYVVGYFTNYNSTPVNRIVRLNANGTIDAGFNIGTGFNSDAFRIAPLTDGSGDIYVVGLFGTYNGTTRNGIIRLNSNGTVDTGFAPTTGLSGGGEFIALARDGSGDLYSPRPITATRRTTWSASTPMALTTRVSIPRRALTTECMDLRWPTMDRETFTSPEHLLLTPGSPRRVGWCASTPMERAIWVSLPPT